MKLTEEHLQLCHRILTSNQICCSMVSMCLSYCPLHSRCKDELKKLRDDPRWKHIHGHPRLAFVSKKLAKEAISEEL